MKSLLQIFVIVISLIFSSDIFASMLSKEATYYADTFEGRYTANGEIFSHSGFTAATCDIPLGSTLYVSLENTGALVRVNDRPNCSRYPNVIDFSKSAFSLFAPLTSGRIKSIDVHTLDLIDSRFFSSLGIRTTQDMPTTYIVDDGIRIDGRVLDGKKTVLIFLQNTETNQEYKQLVSVDTKGGFSAHIRLPKNPGTYHFVVSSGTSFSTRKIATLFLVEKNLITPELSQENLQYVPISETTSSHPSVSLPRNVWGTMQISQDTKTIQVQGTQFVFSETLPYRVGKADVRISGYMIGSGGSLDRKKYIPQLFSGTVLIDRTHEKIGANLASIRNYKNYTTVKFRVPSHTKIRDNYFLTLPSGDVREFEFTPAYIGPDGYLISGKDITLTLPTSEEGTYLIETVKQDGTAYFNLPINRGIVWNILKPYSAETYRLIRKDKKIIETSMLNRINTLRASLGRNLLRIDEDLNRLAQAKVQDMADRNYYGHMDPDGNYVGSLAQKMDIKILGEYRENIAFGMGEIGDIALQDGLEESGSHRFAMLIPKYTRAGIGYIRKDEKVYVVQIFSE